MKVAMLGWEFPPFMAGGLGIHCLELTRALHRRNVEIDFYMPHMTSIEGPLRVADHHDHLRVVEVEAEPRIGPYEGSPRTYEANFNAAVAVYNRRVVRAFDSWDADVLHCHDWITVPAALALHRATGIPLVFTVHSTEYDRSAGFFPQPWIQTLERRGVRNASHVIAVSNYTRRQIIANYDARPECTTPIHNGVNADGLPDASRRDYDEDRAPILFLSRVSRQKGPLFFMDAARRVLRMRPEARFLMVGKGEMLPECVQYAVDHGIANRVSFSGFVPDAQIPQVLSFAGAYVLPSVSEPFGISVLEAMATGLPALVSRTAGVGEAVRHVLRAEFWDTQEMADQLVALLDNPSLRQELGRHGAREARGFTWDATGDHTLRVYQRVLQEANA